MDFMRHFEIQLSIQPHVKLTRTPDPHPKPEKSENTRTNSYLCILFHQSFQAGTKTRVHRWTVRCPPALPELRWFLPGTWDRLSLQRRGAPCCLHSASRTTLRKVSLNSALKTWAKGQSCCLCKHKSEQHHPAFCPFSSPYLLKVLIWV